MNEQNVNEKTWWIRNKKKVFVIGGVVIAAGGAYLFLKNRTSIIDYLKGAKFNSPDMNNLIEKTFVETVPDCTDPIMSNAAGAKPPINNGLPYKVNEFVRKLPEGQHPSPAKVLKATELGIDLGTRYTIVDSYFKNIA